MTKALCRQDDQPRSSGSGESMSSGASAKAAAAGQARFMPPVGAVDARLAFTAPLARDPRFDGPFFTAVRTTGIYPPDLPARTP